MASASGGGDRRWMGRALELARRGQGLVEPNPMVGCVLVKDGAVVGEGWHQKFGGPHAEVEALRDAGDAACGATAFVTLEPCCHVGKTPPCTQALLAAGVERVIAGAVDPNPLVAGKGLAELRVGGVEAAAIDPEGKERDLAEVARNLIAPFAKLMVRRRPWIIAKWAMSLDGKLAASDGSSRWISGQESRAIVHELRGRVDGIVVGRGTVEHDDPQLTARPVGPRVAKRIVLDSRASLLLDSQLVRTVHEAPVLVAAASDAPRENVDRLRAAGAEVWQSTTGDRASRLAELLDELGRRQLTNVLVEGGAEVLGAFLDAGEVDEVHVFIAPKLLGGDGPGPIAGHGVAGIAAAVGLNDFEIALIGGDVYVQGRK